MCMCAFVIFCHNAHVNPSILVPTGSPQRRQKFYASFRNYVVIFMPRMPPTTLKPQMIDTKSAED